MVPVVSFPKDCLSSESNKAKMGQIESTPSVAPDADFQRRNGLASRLLSHIRGDWHEEAAVEQFLALPGDEQSLVAEIAWSQMCKIFAEGWQRCLCEWKMEAFEQFCAISPPPDEFTFRVARNGCIRCLHLVMHNINLVSRNAWEEFKQRSGPERVWAHVLQSRHDRRNKVVFMLRHGLSPLELVHDDVTFPEISAAFFRTYIYEFVLRQREMAVEIFRATQLPSPLCNEIRIYAGMPCVVGPPREKIECCIVS